MKLNVSRKRSRLSFANEDEYQPFLSQPTLFIPNPPSTVKLHHIASALSGYGTSIHSIFFISVRQRPRLGKFSGRSMRKRWVRVNFSSIDMAEQAYVTLHRRPIPDVYPQVLLNFRFTTCFPSAPSNDIAAPLTPLVLKKLSASQSAQTCQPSRDLSRKPTPDSRHSGQTRMTEPRFSTSSSTETYTEGKARSLTRELTEYTKFLEALELDDHKSPGINCSEDDDYNSDRVLYPIDEETEDGDLEDRNFTVDGYSDAGSSNFETSSKLDSLDVTQYEIDTANITAETDRHAFLKSDAPSLPKSLKRTHSNISSVPRGVAPSCPLQIDDHEVALKHYATFPESRDLKDAQTNAVFESQSLIETQTATIAFLRKDLQDLLKAADSQTLIIEGLRKLVRQLEWDKSDLLGMLEYAKETSFKQVKSLQVQMEEMNTRLGFMEARLGLAETKCRLFEMNRPGDRVDVSHREIASLEEEIERRKMRELEESCRRLASMIAQDTHQKHLAVRKDQVRLREKLVTEQARRLREQEERKQVLMKEEAARKVHETEDRQRRERDRRRSLRRQQAESRERKRCHERDIQLWGDGEWTVFRALERFKILLAEFESLVFTEDQPLTMGVVPWPILTDPFEMDTENSGKALEELEWGMVEVFFKEVNALVGLGEYQSLLERTNVAFHPDRWKARRILDTVADDEVRDWLEAKGNMVAQAVTPLWRESKRYKF